MLQAERKGLPDNGAHCSVDVRRNECDGDGR